VQLLRACFGSTEVGVRRGLLMAELLFSLQRPETGALVQVSA